MKKIVVLFMALALAAALLPACNGSNGNGGGGEWLAIALARSVDKQYGPITQGTETTGKANALIGAGSHQAINLKGVVSKDEVVMAAQQILFQWLPQNWAGSVPMPKKSGLQSKLEAMASKAGSVSSQPCEQDSDNDGVPDVQEDKCDPTTDPHCDGLCVNPGLDTVKCTESGGSFTIKFSDCQVNNTTNTAATYTITTTLFTGVTTISTDDFNILLDNSSTTTTVQGYGPVPSTSACTPYTTNGTVAKIQGWTVKTITSSNTFSSCKFEEGPGTVNGNAHDYVYHQTCTPNVEIPCADWNASSTTPTTVDFTQNIQCAWGSYEDYFHATVADTYTIHELIQYPYYPWTTGVTLGTYGTPDVPVHIVLNGSITVHNGKGGVDEQVINTRYNKLTMVWGTGTPSTDTDPFLTMSGQTMHYRVLDPNGNPACGTTEGGPNHGCVLDEMDVEKASVESDQDGTLGAVWETGKYQGKAGYENEDGAFIFTSGGDAIVAVVNQAGRYGIQLVGINASGNPIYNVSVYEKGAGEANKCGVPANAPCKITMEIDPQARTLTVTAISGCSKLDATDIPNLAGVKF